MEVPTRYGRLTVTLHAKERWQERTGRSLWELIGAVLKARRPTKKPTSPNYEKGKGLAT
ncbi:hypothetical protein [Vibrio vulnificus]|uniref:hypothetical protein n=1 Tax=Vibrio vulnificus TaxID=672 RepID=UPI000A82A2FE|nr:hypothetical protein [Vibrio vulnificus]